MQTKKSVAISFSQPDLVHFAQQLALQLQLSLISLPLTAEQSAAIDYLLIYTPVGLQLHALKYSEFKPITVDFVQGRVSARCRQSGGLFREHLIRACGIKPGIFPYIIDATAGLGEDASLLAFLGCKVLMIERSPIIAALLQDALNRLQQDANLADVLNLQLHHGDAITKLQQLINEQQCPDIVYLDPMFEPRQKTALVKKEMRMVRELVGEDEDANDLLATALRCTKKRVIVKRHRLAKSLLLLPPTFEIKGRASRFDVYCVG